MAGYKNYSMSNNAVEAYESGEKPKSKWTKSDLIEGILACNERLTEKQLKKFLKDTLEVVLSRSSWHHTSNYYNRTDFYEINETKAEELTEEYLQDYEEKIRENIEFEKNYKNKETKCLVQYVNWEGTRKHPKAVEVTAYAIIRNGNAYCYNEKEECVETKRTSGKYFETIKKFNRAPRGTAQYFNKIKERM